MLSFTHDHTQLAPYFCSFYRCAKRLITAVYVAHIDCVKRVATLAVASFSSLVFVVVGFFYTFHVIGGFSGI